MRKFALVAAVAALVTVPVAAQAMTVGQFLEKAHRLQAAGIFAPLYADFNVLKAEMRGIAHGYRDEVAAARAAGQQPHSCPPAKGSPAAKIKPEVLIAELDKIPAAQRGMSMKAAFYGFMKSRYPCR